MNSVYDVVFVVKIYTFVSMKKVLKYIGIAISIFLFVLIVAAIAIPYLYKDEITMFATEKLGKQIKADISISKFDLSFLGSIPNISIQLHNVCAKSTKTFKETEFKGYSTDTAMYAERVLLSFNVLDFLFKNYVVHEVTVRDAQVNVFLDSQGQHNWNFSIESDSSNTDIFVELSLIRFRNTTVNYHDTKAHISAIESFNKINFSGKFRGDDFNVDVYADFINNTFYFGKKNYFSDSPFRCNASIFRDKSSYSIRKMKIESPIGTLISNGNVSLLPKDEYFLDLNVNIETSISDIYKVLPKATVDSLAPYKLKANLFVEGNVKGKIGGKTMPSIMCNVACTKGSAVFDSISYSFATKGIVKAKNLSLLDSYQYSSETTSVTTGDSKIELNTLSVHNFNNPQYALKGTVDVTIPDFHYLSDIEGYKLDGHIVGGFSSKGNVDAFNSFTKDFFRNIQLQANLHCDDIEIEAPEGSPYNLEKVSGHLVFTNGDVSADSVSGLLQSQQFTLKGEASDFVSYLLLNDVNTYCDIRCTIDKIDLVPFYQHYLTLGESESIGELLGSIHFESKILDYNPYHLENASTTIIFTHSSIEVADINAKTLNGKLIGTKVILTDLPNNQTKCVVQGEVAHMSAKKIFATFNNFEQSIITDRQLEGSLSGKVHFTSIMDANFNPIYPTINVLANITIDSGSVKNVELLTEIGGKMKMKEEFTNVRFSTLKNTISIKNDTLYIPEMTILSNSFEIEFAGKHNIETNNFNYYLSIFLKKTLSVKFNNANKEVEDFGEIEKNKDGNFKVPIKIYGNPDNYKIDYDFRKTRKNVVEEMAKQKSEWNEILNSNKTEEQKQEQLKKEEPIQSGFQIEF